MKKFTLKTSLLTVMAVLSGLTIFAQGVCTQFTYYYADITYPNGGEQTDLYTIQLDGDDAIMSSIGTLDVGVHIAFNTENGLLYAIDDNTGEISIVDPSTGEIITTTATDQNVGKVTTAAFNDENILLIGSENGNIYQVTDLTSDPIEVSVYSDGNDISGGDITFGSEGELYLAAKPQGKFYEVIPGFANPLLGNVNGNVTGMATLENGEGVIVSSRTNNQFLTYTVNGGVSESVSYNALLDGETFTLGNGDMTSGCSESSTSLEGCEDFKTYYIHNAQGTGTDILYGVDFNGMGGAMLTEIAVVANNSHLGVGANELLYIVEGGNGMLRTFNPLTLAVENEVQITLEGENVSNIPAVVVGDDGFVYIGANNNEIYKVNPINGEAEFFGEGNVSGGDLIFVGETLWLANRSQGRFYEINGPGQFDVDAEDINGVSVLPDGNLLIANGNLSGLFEVYETGTGNATGETFETGLVLFNGDLASRCFDGQPEFQGCENFQTYYIHVPQGGSDEVTLFGVALSDLGDATLTELKTLDGGSHLGVGPNGLLYIVRGNTGVMTVLDLDTDTEVDLQINIAGDPITSIPAVVVGDDGFVYVGSSNDNTIYKVDPSTGSAEFFGTGDVYGGDLVFAGGALWLANRNDATFYEVNGPGEFSVAATEINGVSTLPDGNLLIANGDLGSTFDVYEPITGVATGVQYETGLELFNGDLASRCFDGQAAVECEEYKFFISNAVNNGGGIYSLTLSEGTGSVELLRGNQGPINLAYDESNGLLYLVKPSGSVAIYDPVTDNLTAYSDISMGSMNIGTTFAAVVTSDGRLLVGSDDQNMIYEVNPATGEASNPIDAPISGGDIVQTLDGDIWVLNRDLDRFYNITDGTDFDVEFDEMYGGALLESGMILAGHQGNILTVVDPIAMAETETTFEIPFPIGSGDLASGCGDNYVPMEEPTDENVELAASLAGTSQFITYPNPTEGVSNVEIVAGSSERAVMEVFDMSGRSVTTLLNQDVQAGNTYRMTFDGTQLPNGVYVVKYVTQSETAIEKIMIAR